MATKVYILEPHIGLSTPEELALCYSAVIWEEGTMPLAHPPCNEPTIIFISWGEDNVQIKQKVLDKVMAEFGVGANDVIFVGGWN